MRFIFDPLREQEQKLEKFRQSFRILISDGEYPPDRQSRLFQACKTIGLDWETARRFVRPDAQAFLTKVVERIVADKTISAEEIADVRRLQRRLLLDDGDVIPLLQRLYDLVERKISAAIIENAAYLSEPGVIDTLKKEI